MRKRIPVTATIMVPDHARLIIAARRLPDTWHGPITNDSLRRFSEAYPGWNYMVAGSQRRHTFRAGGTIFTEGVADKW
jgi:hypothetical protein